MELLWVASFVVLLIIAAFYDITQLRIPNVVCYLIVVAFVLRAIFSGTPDGLLLHLVVFGGALAVGFGAFAFKIVGAGDAKLLAAICLWLGPSNLPLFILLMAVVGGIFGLVVIVARYFDHILIGLIPWKVRQALPGFLFGEGPIPYGVAITGGALWCLMATQTTFF